MWTPRESWKILFQYDVVRFVCMKSAGIGYHEIPCKRDDLFPQKDMISKSWKYTTVTLLRVHDLISVQWLFNGLIISAPALS